jgi:hypothetical protein
VVVEDAAAVAIVVVAAAAIGEQTRITNCRRAGRTMISALLCRSARIALFRPSARSALL